MKLILGIAIVCSLLLMTACDNGVFTKGNASNDSKLTVEELALLSDIKVVKMRLDSLTRQPIYQIELVETGADKSTRQRGILSMNNTPSASNGTNTVILGLKQETDGGYNIKLCLQGCTVSTQLPPLAEDGSKSITTEFNSTPRLTTNGLLEVLTERLGSNSKDPNGEPSQTRKICLKIHTEPVSDHP
jgi:hypothetical protein